MTVWTRVWFVVLVITDRLLGTHLVDREMRRLQRRVGAFGARVSALRQQMEDLSALLHVVQVQVCVLHLRQRRILQPTTWLCFVPDADPDDERSLDLLVKRLVRHKLAAVRTEAVGLRSYVYHLQPDWDAIVDFLSARQGLCDPVTLAWLEEIRSDTNG